MNGKNRGLHLWRVNYDSQYNFGTGATQHSDNWDYICIKEDSIQEVEKALQCALGNGWTVTKLIKATYFGRVLNQA